MSEGAQILQGLHTSPPIPIDKKRLKNLSLLLKSQTTQKITIHLNFLNSDKQEINCPEGPLMTSFVYGGGFTLVTTIPTTQHIPRILTLNPKNGHGQNRIEVSLKEKTKENLLYQIKTPLPGISWGTPIGEWKKTGLQKTLELKPMVWEKITFPINSTTVPPQTEYLSIQLENKEEAPLLLRHTYL
jgi:hypothetical protein